MDLSYSPMVEDLVERTRVFVGEVVLPVEDEFGGDITAAGGDRLRVELQTEALARGLAAPHNPPMCPPSGGKDRPAAAGLAAV